MPTEREKENLTMEDYGGIVGETLENGKMDVNVTSRVFGILLPTLRRQMKNNDYSNKTLGLSSLLSMQKEEKLEIHIKKIAKLLWR